MKAISMGDTGQVFARVESTDDLLALAEALEQEAAARYRELAARMTRQGDGELAAQFESLAGMEDRHAQQVGARRTISDTARAKSEWERPPGHDEDEARGASLSPYQALAFAVRNEERAFAFYSYVAAEAEDATIRALAENFARDELQHAALLRQFRRRAFHQRRPETRHIPADVEELRAQARRADAEAAVAHAALADALAGRGAAGDAALFRRLADEEARTAEGAAVVNAPRLGSVADGLRLLELAFDHYASIAERANDEDLVAEAQRLASAMVARLAATGGARGNALLNVGNASGA